MQTFSRVSSIASSLNFSLPPFLRMLSQKEASSSALELPATPLLQKTSKASLRAYMIKTSYLHVHILIHNCKGTFYSKQNLMEKSMIMEIIIHICHILVKQLNYLLKKNLKQETNFNFPQMSKKIQLH